MVRELLGQDEVTLCIHACYTLFNTFARYKLLSEYPFSAVYVGCHRLGGTRYVQFTHGTSYRHRAAAIYVGF